MFKFLIVALAIILVVFAVFPLVSIVFKVDFNLLLETLKDKEFLDALFVTILAAVCSTLISMFFGIPFAYVMARYNFPLKGLIEAIVDIPQALPHTIAGIALIMVVGRKFLVGSAFSSIGVDFVNTFLGVVLAMWYVSFSIFVNVVKEGFKELDVRYEKVARSLGLSFTRTFFKVSLPMVRREIVSGAIQMWARAVSEFGAIAILAYYPKTISVLAYDRFQGFGLNSALGVTALVIIIFGSLFTLLRFVENRWKSSESR
ncbi:MAG: molybdate/tungstate transport system permease protein [Thermotogaceae bacterium]|nr:molybdate/tungstate transport system permease protein [Thermotogaceae bacterium]